MSAVSRFRSCAYQGVVVHKRLEPRRHAFSYRVFALCLDVDEIDKIAQSLRLFSRGKRNVMSFHDCDHGSGSTLSVGAQVRTLLAGAGLDAWTSRIELVCYPRLLGYVFNPLSVYFCRDSSDRVGAIIYEVTNTLRERRSYVIPVEDGDSVRVIQRCRKELYVSPFTAADAEYGFRVVPPGERVVVGIDLREAGRPVLKTCFSGARLDLTDAAIASLVVRYPLMTLKVVAGIHLEALRLWRKGVPVQPYQTSPSFASTVVKSAHRDRANV